jgi:hypothetical protein
LTVDPMKALKSAFIGAKSVLACRVFAGHGVAVTACDTVGPCFSARP